MGDGMPMASQPNAERELDLVVERIAQQIGGPGSEPQLRRSAESQFAKFANAPVREFVSVFVQRRLRAELTAAARHAA